MGCTTSKPENKKSTPPAVANNTNKTNATTPVVNNNNKEPESQEMLSEMDWTLTPEKLDELLQELQAHHLSRLKEEVKTDIPTFILNNLLMCVQFVENFERAKEAAKELKRDKETTITNKLANNLEGAILGERKCHLLHGMGNSLAYIYRHPENLPEDTIYGNIQKAGNPRGTFMCEGLLPLEFIMTWENIEVYEENEFGNLDSIDYSYAKGSAPIIRFCMEEPNKQNQIPRGYVRIRVVDIPEALRPRVSLICKQNNSESGYVYSVVDDSEKAPEITDSEEIESEDDHISMTIINKAVDEEDEENDTFETGEKMLESLHKRLLIEKQQAESTTARRITPHTDSLDIYAKKGRRPSGLFPDNYPLATKKLQFTKQTKEIPEVHIQPSTPPASASNSLSSSSNINQRRPTGPNLKIPNQSKLLSLANRKQIPLPTRDSNSSGYITTSPANSSVGSEEVRDRWRQIELKYLNQYPRKNRYKDHDHNTKIEPLGHDCFICIKHEIEDDIPEDSDDDSDEDTDSDSPRRNKSDDTVNFELRYYLSSTQVSADYCSEFGYVAKRFGLKTGDISKAVVLGCSVRCPVSIIPKLGDEDDGYTILETYTPTLQSSTWPRNALFWFNHRIREKEGQMPDEPPWPSMSDVEYIENAGCNFKPLGYRSIEFFNTHQSLEWQTSFAKSETILLNTFKHVHWRSYLFAALLYRAFIAPLGAQGIDLENIRNILYFMCHESFARWNDEQPGLHLMSLLNKLYECLGKEKMPNFFIASYNMLKNIPSQNIRLVQAHLNRIRENIIVHCIYAFRNLTCLRPEESYYPVPDYKTLYQILTVPRKQDLFRILIPLLSAEQTEEVKPKKKGKKRNKEELQLEYLKQADAIEGSYRRSIAAPAYSRANKAQTDKEKLKAHRRYKRYEEERKRQEKEKKQIEAAEARASKPIPIPEQRKSIDVETLPVVQEKFSSFRLIAVIDFFIQHFIQMARKAIEFKSYTQATMYVLQIENLCEILLDPTYNLGQSTIDESTVKDYKDEAKSLRQELGANSRDYVRSKLSQYSIGDSASITGDIRSSINLGSTLEVKIPSRKLPTPPASLKSTPRPSPKSTITATSNLIDQAPSIISAPSTSTKRLEIPQFNKSLQSLGSIPDNDFIEKYRKSVSTKETIKFLDMSNNRFKVPKETKSHKKAPPPNPRIPAPDYITKPSIVKTTTKRTTKFVSPQPKGDNKLSGKKVAIPKVDYETIPTLKETAIPFVPKADYDNNNKSIPIPDVDYDTTMKKRLANNDMLY